MGSIPKLHSALYICYSTSCERCFDPK